VRSVLVIGLALVAGCSLLVPLDASSGGDDPDAASPADSSATPTGDDGAVPASDASTTLDADAGPDLSLKCPPNAVVCDDFENDLSAKWSASDISRSNTESYSPTQSLSFNGPQAFRRIEKVVYTPPVHLRVTFRLHAGAAPPGLVEFFKIPFGAVDNWDTATLALDGTGLVVGLQAYFNSSTPTSDGEVVAGATKMYAPGFRKVVMEIDFRATKKIAAVSVDDSPPIALEFPGHDTTVAPAVVMLGTMYRSQGGAIADTYLDDFVIEPL
jgi:hypothetical protein